MGARGSFSGSSPRMEPGDEAINAGDEGDGDGAVIGGNGPGCNRRLGYPELGAGGWKAEPCDVTTLDSRGGQVDCGGGQVDCGGGDWVDNGRHGNSRVTSRDVSRCA